ncbi:hypothetical protein K5549_017727, partial [Capra hircus]
ARQGGSGKAAARGEAGPGRWEPIRQAAPGGRGGAVGTVASGARAAQSTFSIPNSSSGPYGSQDSVHSSPEDGGSSGGRDRPASGGPGGPRLVIGSLPAHLSPHMFGAGSQDPLLNVVVSGDSSAVILMSCVSSPTYCVCFN